MKYIENLGPVSEAARKAEIENQILFSKYGTMIDRDSAYEFLRRKLKQEEKAAKEAQKEACMERDWVVI